MNGQLTKNHLIEFMRSKAPIKEIPLLEGSPYAQISTSAQKILVNLEILTNFAKIQTEISFANAIQALQVKIVKVVLLNVLISMNVRLIRVFVVIR